MARAGVKHAVGRESETELEAEAAGMRFPMNAPVLQDKLRARHQVVDFIPGQPEKCQRLNGPPDF